MYAGRRQAVHLHQRPGYVYKPSDALLLCRHQGRCICYVYRNGQYDASREVNEGYLPCPAKTFMPPISPVMPRQHD